MTGNVNNFKNDAGLTLIEVLVVLALIGVIAAVGVIAGIDTIARSTAAGERDLLVSLLSGARTQALANVNESAHGVHIGGSEFVVFEGDVFDSADPNNRSVPRTNAVSVTGGPDIVFEPLSGNVSDGAGVVTLTDAASAAEIDINVFGRIEW